MFQTRSSRPCVSSPCGKNNNLGTLIKIQLDMFQYASLKYTTCRTACDPCSVNITKLLMKSEFCVRPKREHKFSFKTIKYWSICWEINTFWETLLLDNNITYKKNLNVDKDRKHKDMIESESPSYTCLESLMKIGKNLLLMKALTCAQFKLLYIKKIL